MKCLVGKKSIDFTAPSVLSDGSILKDFNLFKHIEGKNCLLFFYPMDFTFVCPSELIALNNRLNSFKELNVEIVSVSVDSEYVHNAWRNSPLEFGGIGKAINYTMVSDIKKKIIKDYGVEDDTTGVAYRGSYLIDCNKIIRVQQINDFPIGRNIDEIIRLFESIIFHQKNGNVCQAGWRIGDSGIVPNSNGILNFLSSKSDNL